MSIKSKQQGFTIVELLIVIVVIGILAALVITTFTGIQKKARDTERQTDIKAVHGQLEAYFAQNGKYPTLAEVTPANLQGLDADALVGPKGGALTGATATGDDYGYVVGPVGCDNAANGDCTSYELTAILESDGSTFSKSSLN